ncbi:hypothetical protein Tco_0199356 [Tanacetum coccineum]
MFVVKVATSKIGATRGHNLLSSTRGGYEYVHGTADEFKNHQRDVNVFNIKGTLMSSKKRDVNVFIGESDKVCHTWFENDFTRRYKIIHVAAKGIHDQLDHEDLEQLDEFDLEEMDLKWQVAMISMRMKKFYKKTGRKLQFDAKEPVGFDKTKVECYNFHKTRHFARECRTKGNQDNRRRDAWNSGNKDGRRSGKQEDSKALVTIDGEDVDWTSHSEEEGRLCLMVATAQAQTQRNKAYLAEYQDFNGGPVAFGGSKGYITGKRIRYKMRTKPGVDSLSFDDLYNNLRVFENDIKGPTASSSSTQNVAFISENTSSTNDVSTTNSVSNTSGQNSPYEQTLSYSLLANQSSCPQLDHEDLEQLDEFDLEEMDLKWQVAMISMRMKKFYKKTSRKLQFDAKELDGRRSGKQEDSKALVTIDGEGIDWTSHSKEEKDYALMACNSSGSDTEVSSCSNECKESYAKLKKLYDAQREQLSDASIEIKAYTQGLKKVEAQLVAHQQGQCWYEEKIRFLKIDLDDKTDVLTYHKKLLAEAQKEKEDLKAKVEKWHNSSKNLGKLLNTQMSANDKFGLGYGDHRYDSILSYENEVLQSVCMNKESELEKQHLYDRFVTAGGMQVDLPPQD